MFSMFGEHSPYAYSFNRKCGFLLSRLYIACPMSMQISCLTTNLWKLDAWRGDCARRNLFLVTACVFLGTWQRLFLSGRFVCVCSFIHRFLYTNNSKLALRVCFFQTTEFHSLAPSTKTMSIPEFNVIQNNVKDFFTFCCYVFNEEICLSKLAKRSMQFHRVIKKKGGAGFYCFACRGATSLWTRWGDKERSPTAFWMDWNHLCRV